MTWSCSSRKTVSWACTTGTGPASRATTRRSCDSKAAPHGPVYSLLAKLADGRVRWAREYDGYLRSNDKVVLWEGEKRYAGDQEWISHHVYPPKELKNHSFPGGWILSYRKHGRRRLPGACKVMVFHGDPKPHEVNNDYVAEHWR